MQALTTQRKNWDPVILASFLPSWHRHHCAQTGGLKVSSSQGELFEEHVHYIIQCAFSEVMH